MIRNAIRCCVIRLLTRYQRKVLSYHTASPPDFIIGDDYLRRWYIVKNTRDHDVGKDRVPLRTITKRSRWRNTYLHRVNKSDDDRALHDHPWINISIILSGVYREVYADRTRIRRPGDIVFRFGATAHRLEVVRGPVWSLFLTGPKYREWGFRCQKGFVHWKDFTNYDQDGKGTGIGKGCE